jgi:ATP-dependent helicase/nuclease subunit A
VDAGKRIRYPSIAKKAISEKILEDGLSEEMRVLYVAMTRARKELILTRTVSDSDKFLTDEMVKRMERRTQAKGW